MRDENRRAFLKQVAAGAGLFASGLRDVLAQDAAVHDWKQQIGIAFYTVRDLMATDYEGILAKLAKIGYKECEPASGYNNLNPKAFRGLLDRYGMRMPSTHTDYPSGTGA